MDTVARFHKTEDAYLFRSFLESEGIPAYVFDENICQWMWHNTIAFGGVRVAVADEDVEAAASIYREYEKTLTAHPIAVGDVKLWPLALLATFLLGAPFMIFGRKALNPENRKP